MNEFLTWCDAQAAACRSRGKELAQAQRGDEARFEQIRANVYGVFRAVCAALPDPQARARKLQGIVAAWEDSLALAEQHSDAEKAHIERIKLETAAAVMEVIPRD